ncbi:hypothetical protein [Amycolatopsis nivea]|nr:hypothetical protein [Amycolatopsis nivea]
MDENLAWQIALALLRVAISWVAQQTRPIPATPRLGSRAALRKTR